MCCRKTYDHDKLIEDMEVGIRGLVSGQRLFQGVWSRIPILENVDTEGWKYGIPFAGTDHGQSGQHHHPDRRGRDATAWAR